jgi:hypothetical protein
MDLQDRAGVGLSIYSGTASHVEAQFRFYPEIHLAGAQATCTWAWKVEGGGAALCVLRKKRTHRGGKYGRTSTIMLFNFILHCLFDENHNADCIFYII